MPIGITDPVRPRITFWFFASSRYSKNIEQSGVECCEHPQSQTQVCGAYKGVFELLNTKDIKSFAAKYAASSCLTSSVFLVSAVPPRRHLLAGLAEPERGARFKILNVTFVYRMIVFFVMGAILDYFTERNNSSITGTNLDSGLNRTLVCRQVQARYQS